MSTSLGITPFLTLATSTHTSMLDLEELQNAFNVVKTLEEQLALMVILTNYLDRTSAELVGELPDGYMEAFMEQQPATTLEESTQQLSNILDSL
jgi:hypothetical protein